MSAVFQNLCLLWLDLAILWPKVAKIMAFPKFVSFWVGFLVFLWPKVPKNYGIPKIRVFLHPEMLKFHLVGELSCQGCGLKIEC